MSQFTPNLSDVIECIDIFAELKDAQWLIQSMKDAMTNHWNDEQLINHLAFLINEYADKAQEIIPRLDSAFDKAYPYQSGLMEIYKIQVQN